MRPRTFTVQHFAAAAMVVLISTIAFADTVRLKDGSTIKGKVIGFAGGRFTIALGEGPRKRELTFSSAEVESIIFDNAGAVASQRTSPATSRNASYDSAPVNPASSNTSGANSAATATPRVITADTGTAAKVRIDTGTSGAPSRSSSGEKMQPIAWSVKVLADGTANGWTNTGWVVKKGQRIRISGEGEVSLGKGRKATPAGVPELDDSLKLLKNVATGALVAVIGDDNNDFIYVGSERTITASRDGALFLGINEGNLDDNSGFFTVKIEVLPDGQ